MRRLKDSDGQLADYRYEMLRDQELSKLSWVLGWYGKIYSGAGDVPFCVSIPPFASLFSFFFPLLRFFIG